MKVIILQKQDIKAMKYFKLFRLQKIQVFNQQTIQAMLTMKNFSLRRNFLKQAIQAKKF